MNTPITPAQDERLNWLIEECAEVVQEAVKIKRFGFDSYHPDDPTKETNRSRLQREMTDVMGCFALLVKDGDIADALPADAAHAARKKLKRSRHQGIAA